MSLESNTIFPDIPIRRDFQSTKLDSESNDKLIAGLREFDSEAMVKVFDMFAPALFAYCKMLLQDSILADHVVGEVFWKLIDELSQSRGPNSNLRPYLYQLAYHEVVNEKRASKRVEEAGIDDLFTLQVSASEIFESQPDEKAMKEMLYKAITELPDDMRHVIILRFWEGFSIRETARIIGKKENNTSVIQNRAINLLRNWLKDKEVGEWIDY